MEHRCLSPWKGAVAGGLIVFAWNAFSRRALPFHGGTLVGSMTTTIVLGLLAPMTAAFFWTWILGKIPGLTLKDSALYGLFFGLCVGALGAAPDGACEQAALPLTVMHAIDAVVAWTIASLVLSRCYAAACALPKKA